MRNLATLFLGALLAGCASSGQPAAPVRTDGGEQAPTLVLGVYDPRAIALVHYRSPAHAARVQAAVREHERLKQAGDAAGAQRLEAEMSALQELAHRQVFGGERAPEILASIADRLPEIARAAGVDAIVARPDLAWLDGDAAFVDLSLVLAEALGPDAETRRMLPDVLKREPTPLSDLERHRD